MTNRTPIILDILVLMALLGVVTTFSFSQIEEEEGEQEGHDDQWSLSLAANYLSRYTGYGVDLSEDQPALSFESMLQHTSGLGFGVDAIGRMGENGGYQQSSFHLGYERPVSGALTLSGVYTYYSYKSDTISVLAGISHSLALGARLELKPITAAIGYNLFFGSSSANYFSASLSSSWEIGDLTVGPALQASFVSQTVDVTLLPKNRGKGKTQSQGQGKGQGQGQGQGQATSMVTSSTETITGLSCLSITLGLSYPLGGGFSVSLSPTYEYSPSDLGARTSQFVLSAGLAYSLDF